jgi:acyl transferase domain-containing protein
VATPPVRAANLQPQLFVLSARTPAALDEATSRLTAHLQANPALPLTDIAYTLQMGRRAFRHRRAWVGHTLEECVEFLTQPKSTKIRTADTQGRKAGVAFLFPGQGAQQVDMGRELYEANPIFRAQVDLCCERLAPDLGLDLRQVLYPADAKSIEARERLMQTSLTQPALFVVEYAMAQVWLALGVKPQVMIGHSLGEYVAAVLAGIFRLEDALHLLAVRGRLIQSMPGGTMLAVSLSEEELTPLLGEGLSLAAVNGPKLCVVSGADAAVAALRQKLTAQRAASRELQTSHAFHSAMMDPILAEFEAEVARVPRSKPQIPIVSSLYGRMARDEEWTAPGYWAAQLRQAVRFADAVGRLLTQPDLVLLEVGPGQTLTTLARQNPARLPSQVTIHSSPRTGSETAEILSGIGQLWLAGVEIDWAALHEGSPRRRVALPTYPFERKRHWVEPYRPAARVESVVHTNGAAVNGAAEREMGTTLADDFAPMTNGADLTTGSFEAPTELESLIEGQLQLMAKQIEALRGAPMPVFHDEHNGGPSRE